MKKLFSIVAVFALTFTSCEKESLTSDQPSENYTSEKPQPVLIATDTTPRDGSLNEINDQGQVVASSWVIGCYTGSVPQGFGGSGSGTFCASDGKGNTVKVEWYAGDGSPSVIPGMPNIPPPAPECTGDGARSFNYQTRNHFYQGCSSAGCSCN